jgi:hypothetical protein
VIVVCLTLPPIFLGFVPRTGNIFIPFERVFGPFLHKDPNHPPHHGVTIFVPL